MSKPTTKTGVRKVKGWAIQNQELMKTKVSYDKLGVRKTWVSDYSGIDTDEVKCWKWQAKGDIYVGIINPFMIFETKNKAKHYLKEAWGKSKAGKEYVVIPCEITYHLT